MIFDYFLKEIKAGDAEIQEIFNRIDIDNSGTIEFNEFIELMVSKKITILFNLKKN